jgi:hypothetical protein
MKILFNNQHFDYSAFSNLGEFRYTDFVLSIFVRDMDSGEFVGYNDFLGLSLFYPKFDQEFSVMT